MDFLTLKKSRDAAAYYITWYCADSLNDKKNIRIVPQDTTQDSLYTVFLISSWEGSTIIKVAAIDTNYYHYVKKLFGFMGSEEEELQEGIEGDWECSVLRL